MLHPVIPPGLDLRAVVDRLMALLAIDYVDARRTLSRVVLIWLLTWLGWQLVKRITRRMVVAAARDRGDSGAFRANRARTLAQLLRSTGWVVLAVAAVLLTLNQFFNITPLVGLGAVAGLAVSFGAQSLVKDYLAGFFILLENQFIVGDTVEAAGKTGVVERLTLRAVTLRDADGTVHIIPNGQIATLSNKTRGWSRATVDVAVSYKNNIDHVIAALRDEALALYRDPDWASQFEARPQVLGVESFADTGVTVRTVVRTKPTMQFDVARELRRRVLIRLERDGVEGARLQPIVQVHTGSPQTPVPASGPPPTAPDNTGPLPGMS
jgi:small conductance mechanosensitive channel